MVQWLLLGKTHAVWMLLQQAEQVALNRKIEVEGVPFIEVRIVALELDREPEVTAQLSVGLQRERVVVEVLKSL